MVENIFVININNPFDSHVPSTSYFFTNLEHIMHFVQFPSPNTMNQRLINAFNPKTQIFASMATFILQTPTLIGLNSQTNVYCLLCVGMQLYLHTVHFHLK